MNPIRKILVRNFVLDYTGRIFNWRYSTVRASRIIYPLVVVAGYFSATNPNWPTPTPLVWILYGLLTLSLWFGFPLFGLGYFSLYPPQWEELDDLQKFQYGKFNSGKLSGEQLQEWTAIAERLYDDE